DDALPAGSVAVQVADVVPIGKKLPDAGEHATVSSAANAMPAPPEGTRNSKSTVAPAVPGSVVVRSTPPAGPSIVGASVSSVTSDPTAPAPRNPSAFSHAPSAISRRTVPSPARSETLAVKLVPLPARSTTPPPAGPAIGTSLAENPVAAPGNVTVKTIGSVFVSAS